MIYSYKIKTYWNIFINMGLQILHWHLAVRTFLNVHLPNRWIGRAGQKDQVFCKWPPRSPDLSVCVFFLWGYVKDRVYVPPLPANVDGLQERITAAVKSVTPNMV